MRPQRQFRRPIRRNKGQTNPGQNRTVMAAIRASAQSALLRNPAAEDDFTPRHRFEDLPISQVLKDNIRAKGFTALTPIQDQVIPLVIAGRDTIGIANTGTGKTAAFLIPMIEKISRDKNQRVLIITPTRELAVQIGMELRDFSRGLGIRWAMVIGGTSLWKQKQDLAQGAHVVIGTPGRLTDLIRSRTLSMSQFRNVILDEADRMVDIGFITDIRYFISLLPKERQSLFFSATISGKVSQILSEFVRNPVTVSVKKQDTATGVRQNIIEPQSGIDKVDRLHDLLIRKEFSKVLIFGRTKRGVERLAKELVLRVFKAAAIHGNKRQSQRLRTLSEFKEDRIRILLATDVASRGLDIENVSHVINYDIPQTYDDYIHRIGRTGRANRTGSAVTFAD